MSTSAKEQTGLNAVSNAAQGAVILIADKFATSGIETLQSLGHQVVCDPSIDADGLADAVTRLDPHVLVVRSTKVREDAIEAGRRLALIVRAGAGTDIIYVAAASERGVPVDFGGVETRRPESDRDAVPGVVVRSFGRSFDASARLRGVLRRDRVEDDLRGRRGVVAVREVARRERSREAERRRGGSDAAGGFLARAGGGRRRGSRLVPEAAREGAGEVRGDAQRRGVRVRADVHGVSDRGGVPQHRARGGKAEGTQRPALRGGGEVRGRGVVMRA